MLGDADRVRHVVQVLVLHASIVGALSRLHFDDRPSPVRASQCIGPRNQIPPAERGLEQQRVFATPDSILGRAKSDVERGRGELATRTERFPRSCADLRAVVKPPLQPRAGRLLWSMLNMPAIRVTSAASEEDALIQKSHGTPPSV